MGATLEPCKCTHRFHPACHLYRRIASASVTQCAACKHDFSLARASKLYVALFWALVVPGTAAVYAFAVYTASLVAPILADALLAAAVYGGARGELPAADPDPVAQAGFRVLFMAVPALACIARSPLPLLFRCIAAFFTLLLLPTWRGKGLLLVTTASLYVLVRAAMDRLEPLRTRALQRRDD